MGDSCAETSTRWTLGNSVHPIRVIQKKKKEKQCKVQSAKSVLIQCAPRDPVTQLQSLIPNPINMKKDIAGHKQIGSSTGSSQSISNRSLLLHPTQRPARSKRDERERRRKEPATHIRYQNKKKGGVPRSKIKCQRPFSFHGPVRLTTARSSSCRVWQRGTGACRHYRVCVSLSVQGTEASRMRGLIDSRRCDLGGNYNRFERTS